MIIVKIMGGLGNQMFQYATARVLSIKKSTNLYIDTTFFNVNIDNHDITRRSLELSIFNLTLKEVTFYHKYYFKLLFFIQNIFLKIIRLKKRFIYFQDTNYVFQNSFNNLPKNVLLDGYWQSYKYFINFRDIILNDFYINVKFDKKNTLILKDIMFNNSVSVHIRRGDYIKNSNNLNFHGICDLNYYINSINIIKSKYHKPKFYFFSDDINWVKNNFTDIEYVFVSNNTGSNSYLDMLLMSNCKHNIIANSSFSWWAAWLNTNPSKFVIAPLKWFNNEIDTSDLIPSDWIRI